MAHESELEIADGMRFVLTWGALVLHVVGAAARLPLEGFRSRVAVLSAQVTRLTSGVERGRPGAKRQFLTAIRHLPSELSICIPICIPI